MRPAQLAFLLAIPGAAHAQPAPRPVVVELFTSQGCSSCPPADRLLTDLARDRPDVLPLAFHVTYWNRLGWADPYSFDGATERQHGYAHISGEGGVYTPQAVVDGTQDVVGSDGPALRKAIKRAMAQATSIPLALHSAADGVAITIGAGAGEGRVLLVGYDPEHVTAVGRGENAGATLVESNIVRGLVVAGTWRGAALALTVAPPPGERLAALVQAPDGHILAAALPGAR
jgi:hypothetical protein